MAKQTVLNKRSSVEDKAPVTGVLKPGEIAVNYFDGSEKLYIENTSGQVVGFVNDKEFTEKENVTAASLTDLEARKADKSECVGKKTQSGGEIFNNYEPIVHNGESFGPNVAGLNSHAEGVGTSASGKMSHAEGFKCVSIASMSHVEGEGTEAKQNYSHAEGYYTDASGIVSHAEGDHSEAAGDRSHSEGFYTTAEGFSAHSEGKSTSKSAVGKDIPTLKSSWAAQKFSNAYGNASHTEGKDNLAIGENSHTEGEANVAEGKNSHAEGQGTRATAYNSHSEGIDTEANGKYSHAEGNNTIANNDAEHACGKYNNSVSAGGLNQRTLWSVGCGSKDNTSGEITRNNAIEVKQNGDVYIEAKKYNHFEPSYYVRSVDGSSLIENTEKKRLANIPLNGNKSASGFSMYYIGNDTGSTATASGKNSIALGEGSLSDGWASFSSGYKTKALGKYSNAEGRNTEAYGEVSHAEGGNTISSGRYSHSEGNKTKANAEFSHAEGSETVAGGWKDNFNGNIVEGRPSSGDMEFYTEVGKNSHAEGLSTRAIGEASHSEGKNTKADGDHSHAGGESTRTFADNSMAVGLNATTGGWADMFWYGDGYPEYSEHTAEMDIVCVDPAKFRYKIYKTDDIYGFKIGEGGYQHFLPNNKLLFDMIYPDSTDEKPHYTETYTYTIINVIERSEEPYPFEPSKGVTMPYVVFELNSALPEVFQLGSANSHNSDVEVAVDRSGGFASASIGIGTKTQAEGSLACGYYNKSDNVLFSVGCGKGDTERKNAIEVDRYGNTNINGYTTIIEGANIYGGLYINEMDFDGSDVSWLDVQDINYDRRVGENTRPWYINGSKAHFLKAEAENGFFDLSDERKKNFKGDIKLDFNKLKQIPKKYFTWKSDETNKLNLGTSAQEVQKIYPEIVSEDNEGILSVDYSKLSIVALKAVDELHDENEKLKDEINLLKKELVQIKNKLGL